MKDTPPFTSYSRNHEDVLLHRLFGACECGFFIDVGAGHPVLGSVTKALSERGWTGINIEPRPELRRDLAEQRPRDRVLAEVPPLRALLTDAPPRIDLLRIYTEDVEAVLVSNDWHRFRPLVVMVADGPSRAFLEGQGYRHVYFDGLTDYYVEAGFHPAGAFDRPVNAADNFVPYRQVLLTEERDAARHRAEADAGLLGECIRALKVDLDRANREIVALRRQHAENVAAGYMISASRSNEQLAREIAALYASTSWRITRPLRALAQPSRTLSVLLARFAR